MDTENKIALITGGSRRIGATIARYLHARGINIIIHYNNSSVEATELKKELCAAREDSVTLVQGDLKDLSAIKLLVRQSVNQLGRLDIMVNNASAFFPTPLSGSRESDWQSIMDTNLKAPYFLSQAVAPYLDKTQGSIINITDIYADRPLPGHPIYSASKAGLVSLTRSLAHELGPRIRVNAVSPGAILWPEDDSDEISHQRIISSTPLKRTGTPDDIASTVYFLIESPFITGQVISVDGGRTVTI